MTSEDGEKSKPASGLPEDVEVRFYHLTTAPLEFAAPRILKLCYQRGWSVTMRFGSEERAALMDRHLWANPADGFLPHGSPAMEHRDRQPIYLTAGDEMPNNPDVLMLVDGAFASVEEMQAVSLVALMFDGGDPDILANARDFWRKVKTAGLAGVYYAQTKEGGWIEKTRT